MNENIQCVHSYAYYSGKHEMCTWVNGESWVTTKTYFNDANVLCKECTYVQKYRNESDENFDSPPDNEPTFSSSHFHEVPIVNVKTIEESLKEMNMHRVQKKDKNYYLNNITRIEKFNTKRGKKHSPRSHPQLWWKHVRLEMNILMTHLQL